MGKGLEKEGLKGDRFLEFFTHEGPFRPSKIGWQGGLNLLTTVVELG